MPHDMAKKIFKNLTKVTPAPSPAGYHPQHWGSSPMSRANPLDLPSITTPLPDLPPIAAPLISEIQRMTRAGLVIWKL